MTSTTRAPAFDIIPDRHPRLIVWAKAFRRAGYPVGRIALLFNVDATTLIDAGVPT